MEKRYSKIYEVETNSDVKVSMQIAKTTITDSQGTRRINDQACLILKDIDGEELEALMTRDQLDGFVNQIQKLKSIL